MARTKAIRVVAFLGALGVSAGLVGLAAQGTGAYFTDSHDGAINAGTGHIKVDVAPQDLQLNFGSLLPGESSTRTVTYYAHPSGDSSEDIWLVFPAGSADAFTHTPQSGPTPLGRYGHFALASTGGANFVSNNLALSLKPDPYNASDECTTDSNGWGGSADSPATPSDTPKFCAPRTAILLQSGMKDGDSGHVNLEFGFTKLWTNGANNQNEDLPQAPVVSYKIVATQSGIRPDDQFNGS